MVDAAVAQINDRIATDLGSLVEDRRRDDKPRERVSIPPRLLPPKATHNCTHYFFSVNGLKKSFRWGLTRSGILTFEPKLSDPRCEPLS